MQRRLINDRKISEQKIVACRLERIKLNKLWKSLGTANEANGILKLGTVAENGTLKKLLTEKHLILEMS